MKLLLSTLLFLSSTWSWAVSEEIDFLGLYELPNGSGHLNFSIDSSSDGKILLSAKAETLSFQTELSIQELRSLFFEQSGTIIDQLNAGSDRWESLRLTLVFGNLRTIVLGNSLFDSKQDVNPIHHRALTIYLRNGKPRGFSIAQREFVNGKWLDNEEGSQNNLNLIKAGLELRKSTQSQDLEIGRIDWASAQLLVSENQAVTDEYLEVFCDNYCIK